MRPAPDPVPPAARRQPAAAAALARFRDACREFGANRAGLAALEFAMVLPILLIFYISTFEASRGFSAGRRLSEATETAGNLITRLSTVSSTDIANIFSISAAIMQPFPGDPTILVTAVRVDENGVAKVVWSKKSSGGVSNMAVVEGRTAGSSYALPAALAAVKSTFFIDATVSYPFRVVANFRGLIGDYDLVRQNIFRPRLGDEIGWTS